MSSSRPGRLVSIMAVSLVMAIVSLTLAVWVMIPPMRLGEIISMMRYSLRFLLSPGYGVPSVALVIFLTLWVPYLLAQLTRTTEPSSPPEPSPPVPPQVTYAPEETLSIPLGDFRDLDETQREQAARALGIPSPHPFDVDSGRWEEDYRDAIARAAR